jgi:hypothetical protein
MGNRGLREPYVFFDISGAEAGALSERACATLLEALQDATTSGIDNGIQAVREGWLRVCHGVEIDARLTIVNVGDGWAVGYFENRRAAKPQVTMPLDKI